jgi:hypothetical protein
MAIVILFFTIPFLAAPWRESGYYVGLNAFLVWAIWLGDRVRRVITHDATTDWTVISGKLRLLYYFLLLGAVLGLFNERSYMFYFAGHTPTQSIINFSIYIITVILFIKIMINYRYDFEFHEHLCLVFIATSFLQLASFAFSVTKFVPLPAFLIAPEHDRFSGLLADYELIVDYSLIVFGLSAIKVIQNKHKYFGFVGGLVSLVIGLLSGTRSFVIGIFLFLGLSMILSLKEKHETKKLTWFAAAFILALLLILFGRFDYELFVIQRLSKSLQIYSEGGAFLDVIGRPLIASLPNIIKSSGFWGNGSYLISAINGDSMVAHNLFFAVYANYGVPGVLCTMYVFLYSIFILYRVVFSHNIGRCLKNEAIVFLALIISCFVNQFKISAIRNLSSILTYTMLFLFIYFLKLKSEVIFNENP